MGKHGLGTSRFEDTGWLQVGGKTRAGYKSVGKTRAGYKSMGRKVQVGWVQVGRTTWAGTSRWEERYKSVGYKSVGRHGLSTSR